MGRLGSAGLIDQGGDAGGDLVHRAICLHRVQQAGLELRTWGDAYGYALVASGRIDAMCDPALAWWDIASLLVIIPEAGGTLTSWHGGDPAVASIDHPEYRYSAIASNGRVHDELSAVLRG